MAKSRVPERIVLGIFILAIIIFAADYIQVNNSGSAHGHINLEFPVGLIAIFNSLYLFYQYNRINKAKHENRREYMNERRQELLAELFKKNKKSTPEPEHP